MPYIHVVKRDDDTIVHVARERDSSGAYAWLRGSKLDPEHHAVERIRIADYASAKLAMHGKPRRKVANNTYLELHDHEIRVVLHDTAVVSYHADGRLKLDSGGWLTVTTKDRINEFAPTSVRVWSRKGRWVVSLGQREVGEPDDRYMLTDFDGSAAFFDGMVLTPNADRTAWTTEMTDTVQEDLANERVRKLVRRWTKAMRENKLTAADCAQCMSLNDPKAIPIGDQLGLTGHLVKHLVDLETSNALDRAVAQRSAPGNWENRLRAGFVRSGDYARYFTERLFVGAVSAKHGSYPADKRWDTWIK